MKRSLFAALLAVSLFAPGCQLPCCPDTAEEAGIPVRVRHPSSKPAETSGSSVLPPPAAPVASAEPR